jgi:hypothetical protein
MANQSMLFNDKEAISRPARAAIFNADSTTMLEHMVEMATSEGYASVAYKRDANGNHWLATWTPHGEPPTMRVKDVSPFNAVKQLYQEWKG